MTLRLLSLIAVAALCLTSATALPPAAAQQMPPPASPPPSHLVEKLNAYVGCINRLSERSYE